MSPWPHDDPRSRAAFYGDPALGQVANQLTLVTPPFKMTYTDEHGTRQVKSFQFHKKAAPSLVRVLNKIWDYCNHDQATVDKSGASDFCGGYNHRKIRGREHERDAWSNHAYAAAIDLNAKSNQLGNAHGTMPAFIVKAFEDEGWRWGGKYSGRKDFMHFEAVDNGLGPKVSKPATLLEAPQADNDQDGGGSEPEVEETAVVSVDKDNHARNDEIQISAEKDTETRGSWLKRKWRGLTGWAFGGGATGLLGYLTSPWAIVAVFACLLVIAILIVLFMGPSDVRAWVRKQVS